MLFAALRVQRAPVSTRPLAKRVNWVPRPVRVPADAPLASSRVLTAVAPIVLPPSTVPVKTDPGSSTSRSVTPAANSTASAPPLIVPPDWLVSEPPAPSTTPLPLVVLPAMLPAFTTVTATLLAETPTVLPRITPPAWLVTAPPVNSRMPVVSVPPM